MIYEIDWTASGTARIDANTEDEAREKARELTVADLIERGSCDGPDFANVFDRESIVMLPSVWLDLDDDDNNEIARQ